MIAAIASLVGSSTVHAQPDESDLEKTFEARDRYWRGVGTVEYDVLAPLISPSFTGGPAWPTTRQAYRVIRRDNSIILATDGMSDPFEGVQGMGNGFEMELFLETSDVSSEMAGEEGDVTRIRESWAFALLKQTADTVAGAGGIVHMLDQYDVISIELPGASESPVVSAQVPKEFVTDDDCIGILIGGPAPDFAISIDDTPLSPVRMVPVVLITAAELQDVRQGGGAARRALTERLAASPTRHISSLSRLP